MKSENSSLYSQKPDINPTLSQFNPAISKLKLRKYVNIYSIVHYIWLDSSEIEQYSLSPAYQEESHHQSRTVFSTNHATDRRTR
jgi:hypothetical protein